jgi:phosphoribosylformylglycinamidine synthase
MGEDKYNIVANTVMKAIRQTRMVLISTQPCFVTTGRHLVMMPHIERSTFQWNWAHTQRIETMKFHLGTKPCECQKMD